MSIKNTISNCTETTHNGIKYKHKHSIDEFKDVNNKLFIIERKTEGRFEYFKDYRYRNCDDQTLVLPEQSKHREMIINSNWLEEYRKKKYKHSITIQLPSNENVIIRNETPDVIIPKITTIRIKKNKLKLELENLKVCILKISNQRDYIKKQNDYFEMKFNEIVIEFDELKTENNELKSENHELKTEIEEVKSEFVKLEECFSQFGKYISKDRTCKTTKKYNY